MGRLLRRCVSIGALIALLPALAAAGAGRAPASPADPNPGVRNFLTGVKALSPTDVWAVGYYCAANCAGNSQTDQTLIEHWDGTAWTQVASPDPSGRLDRLFAVTATSATDSWAVGYYCAANCLSANEVERTLVLHWNGTAWTEATSPNPGDPVLLDGVSSRLPTDAWAAGQYTSSTDFLWHTLILHWNGGAWAKVPSPTPVPAPNLQGRLLSQVSADSATDAWAVGSDCTANCATNTETDATLILHWNGTRWSVS